MSKLNRVRLIAVGIVMAALSGCATNEQTQTSSGSGQAVQSACEWVTVPLAFKMTQQDGIDPSMTETIIQSSLEGVDSHCDSANGLTPLQILASSLDDRELPIIYHILRQGASVDLAVPAHSPLNESNPRYVGATALHLAAERSNQTAILEMLIDFGASVDAQTNAGATPLHFAAGGGDRLMVELLLERGSDVRAHDERGWTPLHYAASESKYEEVVVALVDFGRADIEATTKSGQTPYDLIAENEALKDSEAAYLLEIR